MKLQQMCQSQARLGVTVTPHYSRKFNSFDRVGQSWHVFGELALGREISYDYRLRQFPGKRVFMSTRLAGQNRLLSAAIRPNLP